MVIASQTDPKVKSMRIVALQLVDRLVAAAWIMIRIPTMRTGLMTAMAEGSPTLSICPLKIHLDHMMSTLAVPPDNADMQMADPVLQARHGIDWTETESQTVVSFLCQLATLLRLVETLPVVASLNRKRTRRKWKMTKTTPPPRPTHRGASARAGRSYPHASNQDCVHGTADPETDDRLAVRWDDDVSVSPPRSPSRTHDRH
ncbi:hypothetical protein BN14_09751 [Rhizoctonia solani AG-1 IB]|uniref:Uncharacterized protein n=1 Tax=Thanatephorus cucumeris (strain AG1-IB / isolate 7/3/14) TaxID=1108050 RepID=M5C6S6_THACB|nr:hypothetical protein BN14_09751 [Rhizoctonia solani AG-1 IB]